MGKSKGGFCTGKKKCADIVSVKKSKAKEWEDRYWELKKVNIQHQIFKNRVKSALGMMEEWELHAKEEGFLLADDDLIRQISVGFNSGMAGPHFDNKLSVEEVFERAEEQVKEGQEHSRGITEETPASLKSKLK